MLLTKIVIRHQVSETTKNENHRQLEFMTSMPLLNLRQEIKISRWVSVT